VEIDTGSAKEKAKRTFSLELKKNLPDMILE